MPLETATAIVGILVVCSQMLSSLKGLYEGSSGAPALASAVQNEICEFTIILLKLQSIILESDSILSSQHGTSPLDIDQLLAGCVCTFDELREQVDSLGSIGKNDIMNRMRWAWMEKSLTKLTQRLQNHKASFTLILTILTTFVPIRYDLFLFFGHDLAKISLLALSASQPLKYSDVTST